MGTLFISHSHLITSLGSPVICYKNNGVGRIKRHFFVDRIIKILFYV